MAFVAQTTNLQYAVTSLNDFSLKKAPLEITRNFKRFTPQNASTFSPTNNNSIVINVGPHDYLDPRECELSFRIKTEGGTTPKVSPLVSSIFRRIVVRDNAGVIIEDIDLYNVLDRVLIEAFASDTYKATYLNAVAGYGTSLANTITQVDDDAGGWDCSTIQSFSMPLHALGLFGGGVSKYFPLKYTAGLQMEIFLESPSTCTLTAVTETPALATDYSVSDVQLVLPIVKMDPAYDATVGEVIKKQGLVYYYNSWSRSALDMVTSADALYNLNFPDRYLKNVLVVQRLTTDLDAKAKDKVSTWNRNNTSEWYFELNGDQYPQFPVQSGDTNNHAQSYNMLFKSMNLFGNASMGSLTKSEYLGDKFIIGMDFETSMENPGSISGLDTRAVNNRIGLHLKHSTPPATAQLNAFAHVDRAIVIKENGVIERLF
jgi:hypothetical protein